MEKNNIEEILLIKENKKSLLNNFKISVQKAKKAKMKDLKNREYWNSIIKNYQKNVFNFQKELLEINSIINNLNTIPKEIFIPFIVECINLHEEEKYIHRNIVLSLTTHSSGIVPSYANFDVIFPENFLGEETKLEKAFYISVLQIAYKELFEKNNIKYVLMPSDGYMSLLTTDTSLVKYFEKFPYLKEIGINIADRRLREPNKKITDILDDELEELKENINSKNLCK